MRRKYKYYSQNGEDCLLWNFFDHKKDGTFVDVGAFDGVYLSNTYSFEEQGWGGVCIEAIPQYSELCKRNRPGSLVFNYACIGDDRKRVDLLFEESGLFSGIAADESEVAEFYKIAGMSFNGMRKMNVPASTLNVILQDAVDRIDFISMDVEGSEVEILSGFDIDKYKPRIIIIEANTHEAKNRIDSFLQPHGYYASRSMLQNYFYVCNERDDEKIRNLWVDARIERPAHPLGREYNVLGDMGDGWASWPPETGNLTPHLLFKIHKHWHRRVYWGIR